MCLHQAVFKYGLRDTRCPLRHCIQRRELGLHICGETRKRLGRNIHRFRSLASHIQADPVLTLIEISACLPELVPDNAQHFRTDTLYPQAAASCRRRHQIGAHFNAIRHDLVRRTIQCCHTLHRQRVSALSFDVCTHDSQKSHQVDNFGLPRHIAKHTGACRQ